MAEIIDRIEEVLERDVRPSLLSHEGNIQIVSYERESKILRVCLTGQYAENWYGLYNKAGRTPVNLV